MKYGETEINIEFKEYGVICEIKPGNWYFLHSSPFYEQYGFNNKSEAEDALDNYHEAVNKFWSL